MEKLVARPLSLGIAIPGVKAKVATGPVPPLLPQDPQVSQFGESCTLSITVLAGVPGAGVGVGAATGVGDATGVGEAAGEPGAPLLEATTEVPAPQPIMIIANSVMETSDSKLQLLCTAKSPRSVQRPVQSFVWC